ncbi:MAG: hypothetical protein AAGA65_18595 [Actinomycetota bacterium]
MAPSSSALSATGDDNDPRRGGPNRPDGWETVDAAIGETAKPVLEIGRAWMMDPATAARAAELELHGPFGFWTSGRAGVLGEVDADVVAAAIGFMAPSQIRSYWENRPRSVPPAALTEAYAAAAAEWGRRAFDSLPETDLRRLAELSDRIAAAANPSTGVLFAAWRNVPRPDDAAGAATVALNVLRELRGGAHLSAAHAVGLGPHGVILSTDDPVRGGVPWAERFGWSAPHPEPDPARRAEAERLTTLICRHAYDGLSDRELAVFSNLVIAARTTLDD